MTKKEARSLTTPQKSSEVVPCANCGERPAQVRWPTTFEKLYEPCEICSDRIAEEKKTRQREQRERDMLFQFPLLYRESDQSRFPEIWKEIKTWEAGNLLLFGPSGKCKTRMICTLGKMHYVRDGVDPVFMNSGEFARLVRTQYDDDLKRDNRKRLREITNCRLLLWDDIGKQANSASVEEAVFELLEHKISYGHTIMATSNATGESMESSMSADRGQPFIRRIREFFKTYYCE